MQNKHYLKCVRLYLLYFNVKRIQRRMKTAITASEDQSMISRLNLKLTLEASLVQGVGEEVEDVDVDKLDVKRSFLMKSIMYVYNKVWQGNWVL